MKNQLIMHDNMCIITNSRFRLTITLKEKAAINMLIDALEEAKEIAFDAGEDSSNNLAQYSGNQASILRTSKIISKIIH